MNNILSYNNFLKSIEELVYENEINEGTGIRGFFNKRADRKVKKELSDEIEMSKSIIDGIKEGLEKLTDNFDKIKQGIDNGEDKNGEKMKMLNSITQLIENSRKSSWDINELIDEGEIDYAGFTANVGLATVTYFGILLSPVRAAVIIHKGYNYFFTLIKNTIRKSLVMLQLNFDQFENLIITKSFQSLEYIQELDANSKISEFYKELELKLFDKKTGYMKGRRGEEYAKRQMMLAKEQIKIEMENNKRLKGNTNAYNTLDQYNNTYTKSLEALRQYSQDDVQKQLDAIKNSINKLAGSNVDLQAYGELVIAAAEEHAYKVSSSIYSKFSKMTEVFSLPNQKKLIDLIQAATKEEQDAAEEERKKKEKEEQDKIKEEDIKKTEKEGTDLFKSIGGVSIGEMDKDTYKYKDIIADKWTYEEFDKLEDNKKETFENWLKLHPEVLEKCDDTLKVAIPLPIGTTTNGYFEYIDALIDYISPCVTVEESNNNIFDFDTYVLNEAAKTIKRYYINLKKSGDQIDYIVKLFIDNEDIAKIALKVIGDKFGKDKFSENIDKILKKIKNALGAKKHGYKKEISESTYNILSTMISTLKNERSHDYVMEINDENEKKEKSEK